METMKAARIGRALAEADLIVIGASNGLDMAEGLNLFCADAHFREAYGDLAQTDGIGCILQGARLPGCERATPMGRAVPSKRLSRI